MDDIRVILITSSVLLITNEVYRYFKHHYDMYNLLKNRDMDSERFMNSFLNEEKYNKSNYIQKKDDDTKRSIS